MSLLAAYWCFRADEVRAIADEMKDAKNGLLLAGIAEDYERIAKLFENGILKLQTSPVQTDLQGNAALFHRRRSSPATREEAMAAFKARWLAR